MFASRLSPASKLYLVNPASFSRGYVRASVWSSPCADRLQDVVLELQETRVWYIPNCRNNYLRSVVDYFVVSIQVIVDSLSCLRNYGDNSVIKVELTCLRKVFVSMKVVWNSTNSLQNLV